MAPFRGWAPRGARLVAKVPHGHWKTLTFVAALRHDRIEAPFVLDGPINGECFKIYVEKVLVPTLAAGDLVMMDNLGSQKGCKSGFDPPVNVRLRHSSQGPSLAPRLGPKRSMASGDFIRQCLKSQVPSFTKNRLWRSHSAFDLPAERFGCFE